MNQKSVETPKKRTRIYTDEEIGLIKSTFKDNEPLVKSIRKFMLQLPLLAEDEDNIQRIRNNKSLTALIRKVFLPTLDPDAPMTQLIDLWMTVRIDDKTPEVAYSILVARSILIDYLNQQLSELETNLKGNIIFKDLANISPEYIPDPKEANLIEFTSYTRLFARNTMISHTEQQLNFLTILANEKDETPEQALERMKKDSMK